MQPNNHIQLYLENETAYADSRVIAPGIGVEHDSLAAACVKHFPDLKSINRSQPGIQGGRPQKSYLLTKRQVMMLPAICRTTQQLIEFQARLIDAFEEMEARLKGGTSIIPPQNLGEALRLAADEYDKRVAAEQALAIAAPLADVATTISLSPNWITLANAAKMLATKARPVGSHRLAQYLRDKGYFIREISASGNECGTEPKQEYVDRGYFKRQYVARKGSAHGSFDPCTVISGKFMVKLTQMWNEDFGGTK